ncbi:MAG: sigma-70 family RNA polymerase sigma factor [Bacteroidales bacterium]|jgi:RNA polymerase sigma-70 factor (ECF subfamily)|nr:sigma-70 family RNA polymerase sigma factor [Bacteroidales bacterium]
MSAEEFKQLYYPFHPKLYRVAFALLNNADDANDILQDTYCKLWSKRKELTDILQPEAFCVRLVKNLCLDFLRLPKNRQNNEPPELIQITTDTTPEKELESKEKIQQIGAMIDRLPKKQRIVMQMKSCGNCSLKEIEIATGESAENVRMLLSRARKTLKSMLSNRI